MPNEIRYERMRPRQIVEAREACPVAYLPIGTIEWHGVQNPVGLDTVKIHGLCIRCAQAGGGLVFPALFYGENREEALLEATSDQKGEIADAMKLPRENFAPGYMQRAPAAQSAAYHKLLLHILREIRSLGFKVIVIAAGHYPLIDHARAAAAVFHQEQSRCAKRAKSIVWLFTGYELVRCQIPEAGDHAGKWETSLMMALERDLVDLDEMPQPPPERPLGAGRNAYDASVEFGEAGIAAVVERVLEQVRPRLENPGQYQGHGLRF